MNERDRNYRSAAGEIMIAQQPEQAMSMANNAEKFLSVIEKKD